jgi:hypothetical protein
MTHYNDIEAELIEFDGEDERNSRLYPRHEWRGFTRRRIKRLPTPEQQIQNLRNRTSVKQKTQDDTIVPTAQL